MFNWLRPRHTVGSVARELSRGLAAGTVRLRTPTDEEARVAVPPQNGSAPSPATSRAPADHVDRAVTNPGQSAP
jgi:hypothetical protein